MKCLYEMNSNYLEFLWDKLKLKKWYIRNDTINNRARVAATYDRFNILKARAKECEIYFNDTEVISWLDTLCTLCCVFSRLKDEYLKSHITIFQEYCIPFSNKRADYLLVYDNKILIIEFSFDKLGKDYFYETKLTQAINYKELLSNILPKEIDVGTYTFLLEPEEDKDGNTIMVGEDCLPNDGKIQALADFIEEFFKKNENLALTSLKRFK